MIRKVFLVTEIDTTCGISLMKTKVYTAYNRAVEAFKVKVAERFIFDAIHDLRIDKVPVTGANVIEMFKNDNFFLVDAHGNESDIPLTAKEFDEIGGEIILEVENLIIVIRSIEEETQCGM